MTNYESCGTLRYRVDKCGQKLNRYVYFTPDTEHCIKHNEKEYTVFVSKGCKDCKRSSLIWCGKEITLSVEDELASTAETAAWKCIKVCITVNEKSAEAQIEHKCKEDQCCKKRPADLSVVGITIPAK